MVGRDILCERYELEQFIARGRREQAHGRYGAAIEAFRAAAGLPEAALAAETSAADAAPPATEAVVRLTLALRELQAAHPPFDRHRYRGGATALGTDAFDALDPALLGYVMAVPRLARASLLGGAPGADPFETHILLDAFLEGGDPTPATLDRLLAIAGLGPIHPRLELIAGEQRLRAGDLAEALAHADRALRRAPFLAPGYRLRGEALRRLGDVGAAAASFDLAAALTTADGSDRSTAPTSGRLGELVLDGFEVRVDGGEFVALAVPDWWRRRRDRLRVVARHGWQRLRVAAARLHNLTAPSNHVSVPLGAADQPGTRHVFATPRPGRPSIKSRIRDLGSSTSSLVEHRLFRVGARAVSLPELVARLGERRLDADPAALEC